MTKTKPRLSIEEILELDRELHPKGNWKYEPCGQSIWCESEAQSGYMVADVRGWGYLTGGGALNLQHEVAGRIQDNTGKYIAAMPDAVAHLKLQQERIRELTKALEFIAKLNAKPPLSGHWRDSARLSGKVAQKALNQTQKGE